MSRHLLGMLESSVVFQVNRDAGCLPGVTSDWSEKTRRLGPLPIRVQLVLRRREGKEVIASSRFSIESAPCLRRALSAKDG